MSKNRWPHKVIMNTDGNWSLNYQERHKPEDITAKLDGLVEAGLDALTVLVGVDDDISWRGSKYGQLWGEGIEERDPGVETDEKLKEISAYLKKLHGNFVSVIEDGNDLMQIYIDAARKHGIGIYPSFRMNDGHTVDERREWHVRSKMKLERQDLLIGSPLNASHVYPDWGYSWKWDYAKEEVRQRFLGLLDETLERYDFDGLELDFCRAQPFFKPGQAVRNIDTMTDFMREASAIKLRHSEKRGRQLRLITRVSSSIDDTLETGIDTERWIREGLADAVVLTSPGYCTQQIDTVRAVEAAKNSDVKIYCGFDTATFLTSPQEGYERYPMSVLRATALNGYREGAVGTHLFNFDIVHHRAGPYEGTAFTEDHLKFLTDVGSPDSLEKCSRCYFVTQYSHGVGSKCAPGDFRSPLPRKLSLISRGAGPGHRIWLTIEDDIDRGLADGRIKKIEMRVRMTDHEEHMKRIHCEVNGKEFVFEPKGSVKNSSGYEWMVFDSPPVKNGNNSILLVLDGLSSPDPWPVLHQCEVVVFC